MQPILDPQTYLDIDKEELMLESAADFVTPRGVEAEFRHSTLACLPSPAFTSSAAIDLLR